VGKDVLLRQEETREVSAKTEFEAEPGDVLRIETPGGGGYGDPVS
jgi:N-methylhydantoinase B